MYSSNDIEGSLQEKVYMKEFTIGPFGAWEGTAKVFLKTGNIADEKVDIICLSVGSTLKHSGAVWNALTRAGGIKAYKDAYEQALKAQRTWLGPGDLLVMDASETNLEAKYVFLVVYPDIHHLDVAYRKVFHEAMARGCSSLAIPGLGCGHIGNSVHASCLKACETLYQIASESLGSIQSIVFVDMNERVAEQLDIQLQAKFGTTVNEDGTHQPGSSFETFTKAITKVHEDDCVICLCPLPGPSDVRELPCKHQFHIACLKEYLKSPNAKMRCPMCLQYFELPLGDQPADAQMSIHRLTHIKLPGHEDCDFVYEIVYNVPDGIQEASHIRPGKPYRGTHRRAYLPGTPEGTKVLRLLKFAFDRRLIFTVGDSVTTGAKNTVVWNNVHHKTNIAGGPLKYGYPDPGYLSRVKEDLAAMGITEDMLPEEGSATFA